MPRHQYLALLRGINVGGKNLVKMADLKACFEANGFADVATYIQSGNVLFASQETNRDKLTEAVEEMLAKAFDYPARVVIRSHGELKDVVDQAPEGFGSDPARYRYDVIFLREPLTPGEAMESVTTREGVDQAFPGPGVLYFSRLIARASQSRLSRIVSLPVYRDMTIRNWNTTTRLLALLDARP